MIRCVVLGYVVWCCAALCNISSRCVSLCCAPFRWHVMMQCVPFCHVVLCCVDCVALCFGMLCCVALRCVVLFGIGLHYVVFNCGALFYVVVYYVVLRYVTLCCTVLSCYVSRCVALRCATTYKCHVALRCMVMWCIMSRTVLLRYIV